MGPQGHPPDGPESPNPDQDREIRFFENPDFSFFRLFKLKDPTIWVSIDSPGPTQVTGTGTAVLFRYLQYFFRYFYPQKTVTNGGLGYVTQNI